MLKTILTPTAGIIALAALPVFFGTLQFVMMIGGIINGAPLMEDGAYYVSHPIPIGLHLITGVFLLIAGPFQLSQGLRIRRRALHRVMGRIFVGAGIICGLTALYMNQYHPAFGGWSKYSSNLFFGAALPISLIIALRYAMRRDLTRHRAWMLRSFAIVIGAGTQRVIFLPYFMAFGMPGDPLLGLMLWASWGINMVFVEWYLRRNTRLALSYKPA